MITQIFKEICIVLAIMTLLGGCSTIKKSQGTAIPEEMIGTWYFDNSSGDNEQMAIYSTGRVVVLYSNGHQDETVYVDGAIEKLDEYNTTTVKTEVMDGGVLIQKINGSSFVKKWNRIDETPHITLLQALN